MFIELLSVGLFHVGKFPIELSTELFIESFTETFNELLPIGVFPMGMSPVEPFIEMFIERLESFLYASGGVSVGESVDSGTTYLNTSLLWFSLVSVAVVVTDHLSPSTNSAGWSLFVTFHASLATGKAATFGPHDFLSSGSHPAFILHDSFDRSSLNG